MNKAEMFDELIKEMLTYKNTFIIDDGMLYYCQEDDVGTVLSPLIRIKDKKNDS